MADPLPSWNESPAKSAIVAFIQATTDSSSKDFVQQEDRTATFDQDGTLWVEHRMYTQLAFALSRLAELAPQHPEWTTNEPFTSTLAGDQAAFAKFTMADLETFVAASHAGISTAAHPRWKQPYTELVYQPMIEVMQYLRANGFKTYIVTGGGQAFVRANAEQVYGSVSIHTAPKADKPIRNSAPLRTLYTIKRFPKVGPSSASSAIGSACSPSRPSISAFEAAQLLQYPQGASPCSASTGAAPEVLGSWPFIYRAFVFAAARRVE